MANRLLENVLYGIQNAESMVRMAKTGFTFSQAKELIEISKENHNEDDFEQAASREF